MKKITDFDFRGKRVLVRVDFNVPLNENLKVRDDTRIVKSLPTIKYILEQGGSVILMSHLGRPKGGFEERFSLKHLLPVLCEKLEFEVRFAEDCLTDGTFKQCQSLKAGQVLLLENLRFYPHETSGDVKFSETLASYGDIYINDAFGTAHRAHASTAIIARFFGDQKAFGFLMMNEIDSIDKFLRTGESPLTAIVGGAKVSTKIGIIENLLPKLDHLIIGGGMAYTFIKAQGGSVGGSMIEEDKIEIASKCLLSAESQSVTIHLPQDSVIADRFSNDAGIKTVDSADIPDGWMGLDVGPQASKSFSEVIHSSKSVLWNGPVGVFEMSNFESGSREIANALVAASKKGAYTLVGGGDSVAAINKFGLADQVSYVSTGGGALMEYLEGIALPGILAIYS